MESMTETKSRTYEEKVEVFMRVTRDLLSSESFRLLVERERKIYAGVMTGAGGTSGQPQERRAPRWLHFLLDAIFDFFTGDN